MRTSFFRYEDIGKDLRRYTDWKNIIQVDDELVNYATDFQGISKFPQYEFEEDGCADVFVVFPIIDYWNQYLGVMYLHAFLKSRGVSCAFVKGTLGDIKSVLKRNNTNLICYSCCATNFLSYYQLHVELLNSIGEDLPVRSVFGGPHATHYPEIILLNNIDYVVRFDGERTLLNIVRKIKRIRSPEIKTGSIFKENDNVIIDGSPNLIKDLDTLPLPSREEYYNAFGGHKHFAVVVASRGCPFKCKYCHNWMGHETFDSNERYFRYPSPKKFIEDLMICKTLGYKIIDISDDTFNFSLSWLAEWCEIYRASVDLPYQCNLRADLIDVNVIKLLHNSNCCSVSMGFDSASDDNSNTLYERTCTRDHIRNSIKNLRKTGVNIILTNIFMFPNTNLDHDIQTIKNNIDMQPDYAYSQAFQPYPGTGAAESNKREIVQYYNNDPKLYLGSPFFVGKDSKERQNIICLLQLFVRMPWLFPCVRLLVLLPFGRVYWFLYKFNLMYFKDRYIRKMPIKKAILKFLNENLKIGQSMAK